jgi:hypothetical protein
LYEVHQILRASNATHILEDMVRDKAWESLFILGPARITGEVQAIIDRIAIK